MTVLISRKDKGLLARWWYSVDWSIIGAVFLLMALGVIFSLAASPPVAERIGLDSFHFFRRHVLYLFPATAIFLGTTLLSGRGVRRAALIVYGAGILLMLAALVIGPEIKGARRWVNLGVMSLQPSEFVKPAFIVLAAWMLAQSRLRAERLPALFAWGFYILFVALLLKQPDMGQTALVTAAWGVMLYLFGLRWRFIFMLGGALAGAAVMAYATFAHVRARVDRFLHPPELPPGARDQMDFALEALRNGGLLGMGPGGGRANRYLPDAHTDFLFAAIGEEFGLVAIMTILLVVAFIALRLLYRAQAERDPFRRLAVSGIATLFGLQAFINMGVNVQLLPAKGMTLPFVSYGGSSLMASAFALGVALALLRRDVERPATRSVALAAGV